MRKKLTLSLVLTMMTMSILTGCGKSKSDTIITEKQEVTSEVTTEQVSEDTSESNEKEEIDSTESIDKSESTTEPKDVTSEQTTETNTTETTENQEPVADIMGVHDVTVVEGIPYNDFIDVLIEGVSGRGKVVPDTSDVNLNKKGKYVVTWTCDGVEKATCIVTVKSSKSDI